MMEFVFKELGLEGVQSIVPFTVTDKRGHLKKSFDSEVFKKLNREDLDIRLTQVLEIESQKNVLRGLHYQQPMGDAGQAKYIKILLGKVFIAIVDMRKGENYGKVICAEGNCEELIYIPCGCAVGSLTLSEKSNLLMICTGKYNPEFERGVLWNSEELNIDWPVKEEDIIISDRDRRWDDFSSLMRKP